MASEPMTNHPSDPMGAHRTTMGQQVCARSLVRGGVAATTALLILAGLGALPVYGASTALADSSTRSVTEDDVPAYRTVGKVVRGTASSANPPSLTPGVFQDTIQPGEKKFYAVWLDDVASAYLSAFALPAAGSKVAFNDGIRLELTNTSGVHCGVGDFTVGSDDAARPVGGYASRVISSDEDGECQEAGNYLFSVESTSDTKSDPAAWPVEIRYMSEPGLKSGTAPEAMPPASSASPAPPSGAGKVVRAGTGFNDAASVKGGVWRDRVLPGQTAFYRVPIDWGQRLFAAAEFANARRLTSESAFQSDGIRLSLYNPARGTVSHDTASYDGEQAAVQIGSARADYTNRDEKTGVQATRAMRFSGWYYLAVTLHPGVGEFADGPVDVTLRLTIEGEAKEGPRYQGDAVKAGFGVSEEAFDSASDGHDDGRTLLAFGAFGAGGALLLSLVVWMLIARRRPIGAVTGPEGRIRER